MKNLKIFPKMFVQIFSILCVIVLLVHLLIFFIFPKTYLNTRKEEIKTKANEIADNIDGKSMSYVIDSLNFYSKSSDIKAFIKSKNGDNEVKIKDDIKIDPDSRNNSLIIEERDVRLNTGDKISVQFVSTANMKKEAKSLSFKFVPYSLSISLLLSLIVSLIYARTIKNNIHEIKNVTNKMMELDKDAVLKVDSKNEVGELKEQINDLYLTLLESIDGLESKNKEIIKLEKQKYDFFKGISHELKTPLASLKIILENMKYNIGKYKDRDAYINDCIDIVDRLTQNISQIISVSSLEHLKNDEEILKISDILNSVLKKYEVLINQKRIKVNNLLLDEKLKIGKTALNIVLSNLVGNAIKYSEESEVISIGCSEGWVYVENTKGNCSLDKENSNGLGLYIVSNLLDNYKIKHRIVQNDECFIFKIKIFNNEYGEL